MKLTADDIIGFITFAILFFIPILGITSMLLKKFIARIRIIRRQDQGLKSIGIAILLFLLVLGGIQLLVSILYAMFDISLSWAPRWLLFTNTILFIVYILFILPITYGLGPVVAASGIGSKKIINTAFSKDYEDEK